MPNVPIAFARVLIVLAVAIGPLAARAQPVVDGDRLTTPQGRTLYVFDNDVVGAGRSVCNAPCSNVFPPYLVEDGADARAPLGIVRRDDGTRQWSHQGRPLYRFYADEKKGDTIGDGMNRGTWHVARP